MKPWSDWLDGWMTIWLDGWMTGWLDGWITGWLDDWMAGWLDDWMAGWLDGWMVGWLDDWMVGWLDGWMTGGRHHAILNTRAEEAELTVPEIQMWLASTGGFTGEVLEYVKERADVYYSDHDGINGNIPVFKES